MKKYNSNGFILVIVIMVLSLVASEMFVLSGGSRTILLQVNNSLLESYNENLIVSGLAWSKFNVTGRNSEEIGKEIDLNTDSPSFKNAGLVVKFEETEDKKIVIQIAATCQRARETIKRNKKFLMIE